MTVITKKKWNPATKRYKVVQRIARVTYSRPHGRPSNVRRVMKMKRLDG